MARSRRLPKLPTILKAVHYLTAGVPQDCAPEYFWRESLNGNTHVRYRGTTRGQVWTVDIYAGKFYRLEVSGISEVARSPESAVLALRRYLVA